MVRRVILVVLVLACVACAKTETSEPKAISEVRSHCNIPAETTYDVAEQARYVMPDGNTMNTVVFFGWGIIDYVDPQFSNSIGGIYCYPGVSIDGKEHACEYDPVVGYCH